MATRVPGSPGSVVIEGKSVRVVASADGLDFLAKGAGEWIRVATLAGTGSRSVELVDGGPWIRITATLPPQPCRRLNEWVDRLRFAATPDWSFAPSVGGYCPDAQYKAPLIMVQAGPVALGLVPDLSLLDASRLADCFHALDLDVPAGPVLSVGYLPGKLLYHSVYGPDPEASVNAEAGLVNSYFVLATACAKPARAYREAVRFHWSRFGRTAQRQAASQQGGTGPLYAGLGLWSGWRRKVWVEESPAQWLRARLPDGTTGGAVATRRWVPGPSIYLSSWFNSMRTSVGMALFARRVGDADLLERAQETLAAALKAPGRDGAFKCVAVPAGEGQTLWAAGDGAGSSTEAGFLGYDMAWTASWLLRWREAGLPGSEPILGRCRALAGFFLERQAGDGMLPTRFREDGTVDEALSRQVKAETGPVAHFLLSLHAQDPDPAVLRAALSGLEFLGREVIPLRQWYDYETFWSCSPREERFDARSAQWPANNLALGQAVAAFLLASRATGERRWLDTGEELLDYLLLTQQCWTNPRVSDLSGPAMLLGGFTTQNSDAEWSDARQSQCGTFLLDYHLDTGCAEYLERGIAALRAQFPVSPAENWAHTGTGTKEGVSSFHWGTGSGMAGIEIHHDLLRDGVVDIPSGRAVGVNGLDLGDCRVDGDRIGFSMTSPFDWTEKPVIVFRGGDASLRYRILVNGREAGAWSCKELAGGVPLPF
jgi:hypothetical protein